MLASVFFCPWGVPVKIKILYIKHASIFLAPQLLFDLWTKYFSKLYNKMLNYYTFLICSRNYHGNKAFSIYIEPRKWLWYKWAMWIVRNFNFAIPNNLVTFIYVCTLYWIKNTLLLTYSTNILVCLLTVNMKNCLTQKMRKCATPF